MQPPTFNEIQGAFGLVGLLALIGAVLLARVPVDECDHDPPCCFGKRRRLEQKELQAQRDHDAWHPPSVNVRGCPRCEKRRQR